jgi:hypothetical protein
MTAERLAGVTAVAVVFLLAAAYLLVVGLIMLLRPGAVSMAAGAPLLGGLELAGAYMFLLTAAVGGVIGLGLLHMHNWARWVAIAIAGIGVLFLLPAVSTAVVDFRSGNLAWGGLGMIVRVMIVWYLCQSTTREAFSAT